MESAWDLLIAATFSTVLLVCAAALMVWHVWSWRISQHRTLEDREREYRERQYRRRMFTSALLAVVAMLLPVGQGVMFFWPKGPVAFWMNVVVWGLVLLLLGWVGLLAIADVWATKVYFDPLRHHCTVQRVCLEAELRRVQARESNGKAPHGGLPPKSGFPKNGPNSGAT